MLSLVGGVWIKGKIAASFTNYARQAAGTVDAV